MAQSVERDYTQVIAALRRKANDPSVTSEEREALNAKATELATKYNIIESNRNSYNGQVPTFDEFMEYFKQSRSYTRTDRFASPTAHFITFTIAEWDQWIATLDEKPEDNGNYEFPQEEY